MVSMRAGKLLAVEPHVSPRIINLIKEQISMESEHTASSRSLVALAAIEGRANDGEGVPGHDEGWPASDW